MAWSGSTTNGPKLRQRKRMVAGNKPASIRYSPDGERIAVGFYDTPRIAVLSARDLTPIWASTRDAAANLVNLYSLSWAARGKKLCAGGESRAAGSNHIRGRPADGRGKPVATPVARTRLGDIATTPSGEIAFTTDDPSIGLVDGEGKVVAVHESELPVFINATLKLAPDAALVSFPASRCPAYFSLAETDSEPSAEQRRSLQGPIRSAAGWRIEHARDGYRPMLNGKAIALEPYERSRCHAIAPDLRSAVLGTEWNLHRVDAAGGLAWSKALPSVALTATISGNGEWVVAGLGDGTLRWYRMDDGAEVLALSYTPAAASGSPGFLPATTCHRRRATTTSAGISTRARRAPQTSCWPHSSTACSIARIWSRHSSRARAARCRRSTGKRDSMLRGWWKWPRPGCNSNGCGATRRAHPAPVSA